MTIAYISARETALEKEVAGLREDLAAVISEAVHWKTQWELEAEEHDKLKAELAALQNQEPVAWRIWCPDDTNEYRYSEDGDGAPLYAAAGAKGKT